MTSAFSGMEWTGAGEAPMFFCVWPGWVLGIAVSVAAQGCGSPQVFSGALALSLIHILKASEKIKGIVFAYDTNGEYDMVKELGVEWMRLNICFPWKDKMFGTLKMCIRDRYSAKYCLSKM